VQGVVRSVRRRGLQAASWLACRLPERPQIALAELAGDVWYRRTPERAAQARRNLEVLYRNTGRWIEGVLDGAPPPAA